MANYYASPSVSSGGSGTIGDPWPLRTALANASWAAHDRLYLRGGTYYGKFLSTLAGGTSVTDDKPVVMPYPGENPVLDGYLTTTLVGSINSSQTTLVLASIEGLTSGKTFIIDSEMIRVATTPTTTTVSVNRGWGSTTPASHSNGALAAHYGTQLSVTGSNTRYQGFEIKNSCPTRDDSHILASTSGLGFLNSGDGNEFINLIIHDNGNGGIFTGSASSNTLLYGNLVYNNGVYNAPRGHGLYLENASGYSRVYENVVLNNFNLGGQFYGVSGPYVGGDTQGLVMSNTSPSGQTRGNLLFGPNSVESPTGSIADSVFYHNNPAAYNVNFGYESGVGTGTVTNNYFLGGAFAFQATNVDHLTFTGNKFDSPSGVAYASAKAIGYTWNNNTYYRQSAGNDTRLVNSSIFEYRNFATWKAETGYDANSTINSGAMPDTVIIRPNAYESGRANITIYTPSAPSSINVDLSTSGLTNGQSYTIKNAFNYFGSDVATGTYNSNSPTISVSLTGAATSVATPTGMETTPSTTVNFYQMIVDAGTAPEDTNGNGVVNYTYRWNGGLTVD